MAVEDCEIGHLLLENSKKIGTPLNVGMKLGPFLGKNAELDTAEKNPPQRASAFGDFHNLYI
jgi:hypothetical protein